MGLTIHGWQWILMMVGAPGLLIAVLLLLAKEPRAAAATQGKSLPVQAVLREVWARKAIYLPLFIGLAFSATQAIGMQAWRTPFLIRTYGWNEARIGNWFGLTFLDRFADGRDVRHAVGRTAEQTLQGRQCARRRPFCLRRGAPSRSSRR